MSVEELLLLLKILKARNPQPDPSYVWMGRSWAIPTVGDLAFLPCLKGCWFSAVENNLLITAPSNIAYLEIEDNLCNLEAEVLRIFPQGCWLVIGSTEGLEDNFGMRIYLKPDAHP